MRFWYAEVPEGAVNFVYLSDSLVLYSSSISHLFRELSNVTGSAVGYAVPIRAAITLGGIHHSEWIERPGTAICLYGDALTRAAHLEKKYKGTGMRVFLDPEVTKLALSIPQTAELVKVPSFCRPSAELKWWLNATPGVNGGTESDELARQFARWFSERHTKYWFSGKNRKSTESAIAEAIEELKKVGR